MDALHGCFRSLGQISALFELLHSCAKIINYLFTFFHTLFFSFSDQGGEVMNAIIAEMWPDVSKFEGAR